MNRRLKSIIRIVIVYISLLFGFATAYYEYWNNNTSNFVLNREFNEHTINFFSLMENKYPSKTTDIKVPFSMETMNEELAPFYSQILRTESKIDSCKSQIQRTKLEEDSLSALLNRSIDSSFQNYKRIRLASLITSRDSIQNELGRFNVSGQLRLENKEENEIQIKAANLNYKLAKTNLAIAETTSSLYSILLKRWTAFGDAQLVLRDSESNSNIIRLYHLDSSLNDSLLTLKNNVFSLIGMFHSNRLNKVGYFDFFYFSVVTATATGFGDIVPNSTEVRILTTLQILASLVIFGIFLTKLTANGKIES